jgi:hypothetical protein
MKTILVPISLGELYDKVSVLEIKKELIKDAVKLNNITKELAELLKIFVEFPIDYDLYNKLKQINLDIWHAENEIRTKQKEQKFDKDFIVYARKAHEKNDERSEIKRQINLKFSSDITEEKQYEKY